MDEGTDNGIFEQIKDTVRSGSWLGQMPWLYRVHQRLVPFIGDYLGVNKRSGFFQHFTIDNIRTRKERGSDRADILEKLFDVHEQKPSEMSFVDVASMASANIVAGSDTTATSLRAIIYYLLRNPLQKSKLVDEIDAKIKEGQLSKVVTFGEANEMPYLQAVMQEALRLCPAVGMNLPRVTPQPGIVIGNHKIPAGVCHLLTWCPLLIILVDNCRRQPMGCKSQ
jgi:cytochrome P450